MSSAFKSNFWMTLFYISCQLKLQSRFCWHCKMYLENLILKDRYFLSRETFQMISKLITVRIKSRDIKNCHNRSKFFFVSPLGIIMLVFGLFKHQRKLSEKKEKSLRIFSEYESLPLCKSVQIKKLLLKISFIIQGF